MSAPTPSVEISNLDLHFGAVTVLQDLNLNLAIGEGAFLVQQLASPDEIYNRPVNRCVAQFIGSPTISFVDGTIADGRFSTPLAGFALDGYAFDHARPHAPAVSGIRPEHVACGAAAATQPARLSSTAELVEPLGSGTLVRVRTGDRRLWVRMGGQAKVRGGDALPICFGPERANTFDATTEERLQGPDQDSSTMDVSLQLYSARDFRRWDGVVARLAELGYSQVEGFGGVYGDPAAFRDLLDRHGLAMPSGHFSPISCFEEGLETALATARVLGINRLFCPAPEDAFRQGTDADAWIGLARRLEAAGQRVRDAGFAFGWHNHHWEFMPLPGGEIAMDLILEYAPSIDWEMDVAWVVRGGADPLTYIDAHGARITTAHVKDIAPEGQAADEDGWADPGHGVMDWPAIMAALKAAGADLFIAEHDKPSDFGRFAERAIDTIRKI